MLSELRLQEAIDTLYSYSLVTRTTQNSSFYIHPVIHRWSRERQTEVQQSRRSAVILRGLGRLFPEIILPPTQERCAKVLRHAKFYVENCLPSLRVEDVKEEDFDTLDKIGHSTLKEKNNQINGTICLKSLDLSRSFPGLPKEKLDGFWLVICVYLRYSGWHSVATFISEAVFSARGPSNETLDESLDAYSNALNHHLESRSIDARKCCYKAVRGFISLFPSLPRGFWIIAQSHSLLSIIEASQNNRKRPLQDYVELTKVIVRKINLPASVCSASDYQRRVLATVCCAIAYEECQDYETAETIYRTAVESMWRLAEGERLLLHKCIMVFAIFLLNRKRYQECEIQLRRLLAIPDRDNSSPLSCEVVETLSILGLVTFQQREFIKSASFLRRIVEVEESWSAQTILDFLDPRLFLCVCLAEMGQNEEAITVATEGIRHYMRINTGSPSRDNDLASILSVVYYFLKRCDSCHQSGMTELVLRYSHELVQNWNKVHVRSFFCLVPLP